MKIEKEFTEDHQVKLTVEIDPDTFEKAKHRAARQIAKQVKIPGFRPGKAPYGVIVRTVGEGHIVENAVEILIDEQYPEIIKQAEIETYGPGKLDNIAELDPPTFEFTVPLDATVELGDYKSIRIPYEPPVTTEEEVQQAIERIREENATRESVERPADIGDTVFLRISGVRIDAEDDEDSTIIEERFSSSVIREDARDDEFPFPGFSMELVGLSPEDKKDILYNFPDDYEEEDLQGAAAKYSIVVTNVQSTKLPDLTDEFAKEVSEFDSLESWQADLKSNLQDQALATYDEEYDNDIVEQIIATSSLKYPPQMVENESQEMLRGLEYRLSQQGINKDLYLQIRGMDEEALLEEIEPMAEERLKQALVLYEISDKEEIEIDQEKVQTETIRTFEAISSQMTPNEAKKLTKSQFLPNLMANIAVDLTTQTTMDYLHATAKGEPWPPEKEGLEEDSEESKKEVEQEVETVDKDTEPEKQAITSEKETESELENEESSEIKSEDLVNENSENEG